MEERGRQRADHEAARHDSRAWVQALSKKNPKKQFCCSGLSRSTDSCWRIRAFVQENLGFGSEGGGGVVGRNRWLIVAGLGQVKWCLPARSGASQRPDRGPEGPES